MMLKTFKDLNGETVCLGDPVSVIDSDYPIMIVKSINRVRRGIEVKMYNNLDNFYYYKRSTKLVSEK